MRRLIQSTGRDRDTCRCRFRGSGVPGFRGSGVPEFRGSRGTTLRVAVFSASAYQAGRAANTTSERSKVEPRVTGQFKTGEAPLGTRSWRGPVMFAAPMVIATSIGLFMATEAQASRDWLPLAILGFPGFYVGTAISIAVTGSRTGGPFSSVLILAAVVNFAIYSVVGAAIQRSWRERRRRSLVR